MALTLRVKVGESVWIGDAEVRVAVVETGAVSLTIEADRTIKILRGKLYERAKLESMETERGPERSVEHPGAA